MNTEQSNTPPPPLEPPATGPKIPVLGWFLHTLSHYADFTGRARRREYWLFSLTSFLFAHLAIILDKVFKSEISGVEFGPFYVTYILVVLLPGLALAVRRLHDTGRSAWYLILPVINIAAPFFIFFFDSKEGENKYGPNPKTVYRRPSSRSLFKSAAFTLLLWVVFQVVHYASFRLPALTLSLIVGAAVFPILLLRSKKEEKIKNAFIFLLGFSVFHAVTCLSFFFLLFDHSVSSAGQFLRLAGPSLLQNIVLVTLCVVIILNRWRVAKIMAIALVVVNAAFAIFSFSSSLNFPRKDLLSTLLMASEFMSQVAFILLGCALIVFTRERKSHPTSGITKETKTALALKIALPILAGGLLFAAGSYFSRSEKPESSPPKKVDSVLPSPPKKVDSVLPSLADGEIKESPPPSPTSPPPPPPVTPPAPPPPPPPVTPPAPPPPPPPVVPPAPPPPPPVVPPPAPVTPPAPEVKPPAPPVKPPPAPEVKPPAPRKEKPVFKFGDFTENKTEFSVNELPRPAPNEVLHTGELVFKNGATGRLSFILSADKKNLHSVSFFLHKLPDDFPVGEIKSFDHEALPVTIDEKNNYALLDGMVKIKNLTFVDNVAAADIGVVFHDVHSGKKQNIGETSLTFSYFVGKAGATVPVLISPQPKSKPQIPAPPAPKTVPTPTPKTTPTPTPKTTQKTTQKTEALTTIKIRVVDESKPLKGKVVQLVWYNPEEKKWNATMRVQGTDNEGLVSYQIPQNAEGASRSFFVVFSPEIEKVLTKMNLANEGKIVLYRAPAGVPVLELETDGKEGSGFRIVKGSVQFWGKE
ncbi:MAG: DUF805 domain-containing protein [Puniceicoccales bacterium]|jgi:uncharacterized membrane protein YhaH (DUF805 family)|nr:DUF805 domain-containing protein [Puniceicoccales bacterium]